MEGIAMPGMFNTRRNDTGTGGEMADFSHGINLVESYLPDAISCLAREKTPARENFSGCHSSENAYCAPMQGYPLPPPPPPSLLFVLSQSSPPSFTRFKSL